MGLGLKLEGLYNLYRDLRLRGLSRRYTELRGLGLGALSPKPYTQCSGTTFGVFRR